MIDGELARVPPEARPYQGVTAGVVTRTVASTVDGLVVGVALLGAWIGLVAVTFVLSPRDFTMPDVSLIWFALGYFDLLVIYLTAAWAMSGRTIGNHVMGLRVVTGRRRRLRFLRALSRALLCALFPIGLFWCAVSPRRRSMQDVLLHTAVIYDWLPRPEYVDVATTPQEGTIDEVGGAPADGEPAPA